MYFLTNSYLKWALVFAVVTVASAAGVPVAIAENPTNPPLT